jgi:hypothetical protein
MRKQLIALLAACAWVSLVLFDRDGAFGTVAMSLPAVLFAGIFYWWFGQAHRRRAYLWVFSAMAAWVSAAVLKGYKDCCSIPFLPSSLDSKLKSAAEVQSEIIAFALPAVLFGSVAMWWLSRRKEKDDGQAAAYPEVIDAEYIDIEGKQPRLPGTWQRGEKQKEVGPSKRSS